MSGEASPSGPVPLVLYDPADPNTLPPTVEINAAALAGPLQQWGVDGEKVAAPIIHVTHMTRLRPGTEGNRGKPMHTEIVGSGPSSTVYLHMGSVMMDAFQYPDEATRRSWLSGKLLEGVSRGADRAVIGAQALAAENQAAQRSVALRKGWPRAAGAVAAGVVSVALEYAAFRYNLTEGVKWLIGAVGVGATALAGHVAYFHTKADVAKARRIRDASEGWPVDQRARERAAAVLAAAEQTGAPLPVKSFIVPY